MSKSSAIFSSAVLAAARGWMDRAGACLRNPQPGQWFLLFAIPYGAALFLMVPPFQSPDEYYHFFRAYQISEGTWRGETLNGKIGGRLPSSLRTLILSVADEVGDHYQNRRDGRPIFKQFQLPLEPERREFLVFGASAFYTPVLYLPQACGMFCGRILGWGPLWIYYAGRLANLAAYIGIAYLAIRRMPVHRWVLLLLALMPMPMYLAVSLSADVIHNAVSFLWVALVLSLALKQPDQTGSNGCLPKRIVALTAVFALCKGYLTMLLAVLLVPHTKHGSRRKYFRWIASVLLVAGIALGAWSWLVWDIFIPSKAEVSVRGQLHFILYHPQAFIRLMWTTYHSLFEGRLWSFIGCFGWLDTPLPRVMVYLYSITLILTACADSSPATRLLSWPQKILGLGIAFLTLCLISVWIDCTWNAVGNIDVIRGIPGRYFIPVAPLALLIFQNPVERGVFPRFRECVGLVILCSIAVTLGTIAMRYY